MPTPFTRVLAPVDGSEPSDKSLEYAIALGRTGASVDLVNVVDEIPIVSQSATTVSAFDPTPLLEALDAQGHAVLAAAAARCREAGITPTEQFVRDVPVPGIVATAEQCKSDLIVLGTHGRHGLAHAFLGSTTEGVLEHSHIPVLTVRIPDVAPANPPFRRAIVAVDDSDPADAAVNIAVRLHETLGTEIVFVHAIDPNTVLDRAATYGYDPTPLIDEMRSAANALLERARAKAPASAAQAAIVEGHSAKAIANEAAQRGADLIIVGSHGRRGIRRFFLGSVAEEVVRTSVIPVLVMRA
jgi:nucleotide-binding universal stress UspA family protein